MTWSHGTESDIVEPNIKEQWLSSIYVLLLLLLFIYLLIFFLVNISPHHLASSKVDFVPCNQNVQRAHERYWSWELVPLRLSPGVLFM